MNYIVLEGVALYIFLLLILMFFAAVLIVAVGYINLQKKYELLQEIHTEEHAECMALAKDNFRFRLKYGELDPGEKKSIKNNKGELR